MTPPELADRCQWWARAAYAKQHRQDFYVTAEELAAMWAALNEHGYLAPGPERWVPADEPPPPDPATAGAEFNGVRVVADDARAAAQVDAALPGP